MQFGINCIYDCDKLTFFKNAILPYPLMYLKVVEHFSVWCVFIVVLYFFYLNFVDICGLSVCGKQ